MKSKKQTPPPAPAPDKGPTHDRRGHSGSTRGRKDFSGRKHSDARLPGGLKDKY